MMNAFSLSIGLESAALMPAFADLLTYQFLMAIRQKISSKSLNLPPIRPMNFQ
jgi:hypothetical protein